MNLEQIINDHASNVFDQPSYAEDLSISEISNFIANNIKNGASLTALMVITENIFDFGNSTASILTTELITNQHGYISGDTLACIQTCIYLLYMKHNEIIKLGHYTQVSCFVDMEVPQDEYDIYMNVVDYYDRNANELECLSYLFE